MAPWDDKVSKYPLVGGETYEGGEVVGVTRNLEDNKEAHTGIDFITARRPLHQATYDECIRTLEEVVDTRIPRQTAHCLLVRNEPWVRTRVNFAEPPENARGSDETPMAIWNGDRLGLTDLEVLLEPGGWLREAFTYPSSYFHGVLQNINLNSSREGKKGKLPTFVGVPPYNRTTFETLFTNNKNQNKRAIP